MDIEIKINPEYEQPKVHILCAKVTEEVEGLMRVLSQTSPTIITGFRDDVLEILEQENIIRIYSANQKVFGVTKNGEYTLKQRLYELEERIDCAKFVRISNSEIINLRHVKSFDLSFTGTICVKLSNDEISYVSRRYVAKLKQILGI